MSHHFPASGVPPAVPPSTGSPFLAKAQVLHGDTESIQSLFCSPKPPPLCPFPRGHRSSSLLSLPRLRRHWPRGFASSNPIEFPALPLACFASGVARSVRWLGSLPTCPSDLDLSLEKIREGGGGASLPVSAACPRGQGRPAPIGPPAPQLCLSRVPQDGDADENGDGDLRALRLPKIKMEEKVGHWQCGVPRDPARNWAP